MARSKVEMLIQYAYAICSGVIMSANGEFVDIDTLFKNNSPTIIPSARVGVAVVDVSQMEIYDNIDNALINSGKINLARINKGI